MAGAAAASNERILANGPGRPGTATAGRSKGAGTRGQQAPDHFCQKGYKIKKKVLTPKEREIYLEVYVIAVVEVYLRKGGGLGCLSGCARVTLL